jgi:hypothetical protein
MATGYEFGFLDGTTSPPPWNFLAQTGPIQQVMPFLSGFTLQVVSGSVNGELFDPDVWYRLQNLDLRALVRHVNGTWCGLDSWGWLSTGKDGVAAVTAQVGVLVTTFLPDAAAAAGAPPPPSGPALATIGAGAGAATDIPIASSTYDRAFAAIAGFSGGYDNGDVHFLQQVQVIASAATSGTTMGFTPTFVLEDSAPNTGTGAIDAAAVAFDLSTPPPFQVVAVPATIDQLDGTTAIPIPFKNPVSSYVLALQSFDLGWTAGGDSNNFPVELISLIVNPTQPGSGNPTATPTFTATAIVQGKWSTDETKQTPPATLGNVTWLAIGI